MTRKEESPTHSPEKYYKKEGKSYRSLLGSYKKEYAPKKHESPTESPTERKKEVFTKLPVDVGLHIREVSPTVYTNRSPTESPTHGQADQVNLPIHVPLGVKRAEESPTHSPDKHHGKKEDTHYKKEGKHYRSLLGPEAPAGRDLSELLGCFTMTETCPLLSTGPNSWWS